LHSTNVNLTVWG